MTTTVHGVSTPTETAPRPSRGDVRTPRPHLTTIGIIAAATAAVAYYSSVGSSFAIYMVGTVLLACIGAIALGLLMGTAGQVSIGNSAFLAAGGYAAVWALRADISFPFDVAFAAVVCAGVGVLVGLPALRIRGIYLALATLAAYYVVLFLVTEYQGNEVGSGAFLVDPVFEGTPAERNQTWIWVLLAVVACCLVLATWLRTGRSGRAWRMIRDHEVAAPTMGIPVARYKLLAFVISSAMIGVQGALTVHFVGSLTHETFSLNMAIAYIAMILIGGADSQAGPLLGAVLVTTMPTFVPEMLSALVGDAVSPADSAAYAQIAYGVLLILFIVYAPRGINGWFVGLAGWVKRRVAGRSKSV